MNGNFVCVVCGAMAVSRQYEATDYVTAHKFGIMRCASCLVAYTDPVPQDLGPYYPTTYRCYKPLVLGTLAALYRVRARLTSAQFSTPGSALEIGCGPGIMLNALRQLGWSVMGLERTEEAADIGRKLFGLKVMAADVGELPDTREYDLIILFQVLEHMTDPARVLRECAQRLKPGGRIVLGVPNFDSWQAQWGKAAWLHLDVPRHLFHFSPRSLTLLLERFGYRDVSVSYVSFEHDPYGWVQTILNKIVTPQNALLRYLMSLDRFSSAAGVSVIVGALLALPAGAAAMVSWALSKGAIISVTATVAADGADGK